jgi:hypothetical protein
LFSRRILPPIDASIFSLFPAHFVSF